MERRFASPVIEPMTGFIAHLRFNGFALGPAETELSLLILDRMDGPDLRRDKLGLKTALCTNREQWRQFDELFEAYWFASGRTRKALTAPSERSPQESSVPRLWDRRCVERAGSKPTERSASAESDERLQGKDGRGRLIATGRTTRFKRDLREIVDPDEIRRAEEAALRLGRAIAIRHSRRRRPAPRGEPLDLKRTLRASLARGGEPIDLFRRRIPERPVKLVLLLDVSGSMQAYSRFFLQFAKGLIKQWLEAEAFIFHTRLVKVSDALRERDPFRAMARLSLMTQGIGGGTRIGASVGAFNDQYAKRTLNSRSVVLILSDGYDTSAPNVLARELGRLKRRARRIVWLNPLAGWRDYEPVARAMAAAMPLLDGFAPATRLEDLAAVEPMLSRLK